MPNYDVLIIGGGPAGTAAALKLGRAGKKVGLVEKDAIGGVCLNRGCIPSKTYLHLVELLDNIKKAKRFGIEVGEPRVIWDEVKKRKDSNVKMLGLGLTQNLKTAQVSMISGEGTLVGPHEVHVKSVTGETTLTADHIILALGSNSLFLPAMPQGKNIISSTEILNLEKIPARLAVIGGGVTGVEMASIFCELGTEVTVFERGPRILPVLDADVTTELKRALEKKGCKIFTDITVTSVQDKESGTVTSYKTTDGTEQILEADKTLVVIGRVVNADFAAYTKLGLANDGKRFTLNNHLQTSLPHVYVIGDAAFKNLTAYGGELEGEAVAAHIMGHEKKVNYDAVPVTVFSHPEIGAIGLTEDMAQTRGISYEIKKSTYGSNAKALILGAREGLVKIIIETSTQKILGVEVIGVHASDLIHQAIIPVIKGMTVSDWRDVVFSHPVLSEVLKNALG